MRSNRLMKVFIWVVIGTLVLSTLFISIGWMFE
jgi:hypothetical protein